jgi:hypothetical protein
MPSALEAARGDRQPQAPQAFHGIERQGTQAVATLVILVAEGHLAVRQGNESVVGDGDPVGIAGEGLQDMLGVLQGLFGVDHPCFVAQGGEEPLPGRACSETLTATCAGQLALRVELRQTREVEAPEAP